MKKLICLIVLIFGNASDSCAMQQPQEQSAAKTVAKKARVARAVHAHRSHKSIRLKQESNTPADRALDSAPRGKARASHRVQKRQKAEREHQVRRNFWDRCIACFCCDSCSENEAELEAERRRRLAQQKALQKRGVGPQPESHLFDDAGLVLAVM